MAQVPYTVEEAERVRALTDGMPPLGSSDTLTYSFEHGHESLTVVLDGGGRLEYGGAYHPGDGCCVGNTCHHCGAVSHDARGD